MKWDFFVRHYADEEQQQLDPSYRPEFGERAVSEGGSLRGMYRAQRNDSGLSAKCGLGFHRRAYG